MLIRQACVLIWLARPALGLRDGSFTDFAGLRRWLE